MFESTAGGPPDRGAPEAPEDAPPTQRVPPGEWYLMPSFLRRTDIRPPHPSSFSSGLSDVEDTDSDDDMSGDMAQAALQLVTRDLPRPYQHPLITIKGTHHATTRSYKPGEVRVLRRGELFGAYGV